MAVHAPEPATEQPRRRASKRAGYWALLRAVPRTVARSGFRGLTYRALAKEAGVTYGLISYHFGSREALIEDAARLAVDEAISKSQLLPESGKVEDFASGLPRLLREDRDAQVFQYDLVTEAMRNEALQEPVAELYRRYVAAVEEALGEFGIEDDPGPRARRLRRPRRPHPAAVHLRRRGRDERGGGPAAGADPGNRRAPRHAPGRGRRRRAPRP